MILSERWERILDLLYRDGGVVPVQDIADGAGVSLATARRDLTRLEARGLIVRTRGGASAAQRMWSGPTMAESRHILPEFKSAVGRRAAQLVQPGEVVMLDAGFTTSQVACHIQARPLTVVTNSFDVATALVGRDGVSIILLGGELEESLGATHGPLTEMHIRQLSADKAILGADAISARDGLGTPLASVAKLKQLMVEHSNEVIVVADHSKVGRSALYRAAPASAVTRLVTDDLAPAQALDALRAAGVEVILTNLEGAQEKRKSMVDASKGSDGH